MTTITNLRHPTPAVPATSLAEVLRSDILAAADEAERERRLPTALLEQLRSAGAFRLYTPRELGGHELGLPEALTVFEQLARLDGSVAWNVWNGNLGFAAAVLEAEGIEAIWGTYADPVIANSARVTGTATSDGDGFRLSGRWDIVSAIDAADWVGLFGVVLAEDGRESGGTEVGGPDVRVFFVRRPDVTVVDTWHVSGMRGTGSNTVIAQHVFVPGALAPSPFLRPEGAVDRPLYRIPAFTVASVGCAGAVLGLAQAAVDELMTMATTKATDNGSTLRHRAHAHREVAIATTALRAARLLLHAAAQDVMDAASAGSPIDDVLRAGLRAAMSHVADTSRQVLLAMFQLGSSSSLYIGNRLERIFRDGMAAAQHALLQHGHFETAGRILFGLDAAVPVF